MPAIKLSFFSGAFTEEPDEVIEFAGQDELHKWLTEHADEQYYLHIGEV